MKPHTNSTPPPGAADATTADGVKLALYHFPYCPYCVRVFRALEQMGRTIEMRDIVDEPARRAELIAGGGKKQVPCLRIERADGSVEWMYESLDIIDYLGRTLT